MANSKTLPKLQYFRDLPLEARFKFPGSPAVWVKTGPSHARPVGLASMPTWIAGDSAVEG